MDKDQLSIQGTAGDPIWVMCDGTERIGVRLDSGDGGVVYLSKEQAKVLAEQLTEILAELQ